MSRTLLLARGPVPAFRSLAPVLVAIALVAAPLLPTSAHAAKLHVDDVGDGPPGTGVPSDPYRDLQFAIDAASDGDTLLILPGTYEADPVSFTDELCGNCEEHATPVPATRGFYIAGKSLTLKGSGIDVTTLVTNAGYGVYFEDSAVSSMTELTVTGGVRDEDDMATDAGIVVRRTQATIAGVAIVDNTDRHDEVVVGIGGVMGREGAEIRIVGCTIANNGWDGVALYRGATAYVADNVISDGRGAGVGVTWDASAVVLRNRIWGYWKGVGSFGNSTAVARNNDIFDNLGWGLVATGSSSMDASNNVVTRNGNCGVALWSDDATLVLTGNIVTGNGWRDEWVCPRVGIWLNGDEDNLDARFNDVWGNVEGDYLDIRNLTGSNGNVSADPRFSGTVDFRLLPGSPCLGAGDPFLSNPDGAPADMGSLGGPEARSTASATDKPLE
jgi:hypothetical protein